MKRRLLYLCFAVISFTFFSCKKHPHRQVRKPVIYLYPETKTDVTVQLYFSGELQTTYPKYENGWNVVAENNGSLTDKKTGKTYSYLFWEGESEMEILNDKVYSEGFFVSKNDAAGFLELTLTKIGLTPKERNDFIVYWLPELEKNPLNFVYFLSETEYHSFAKLNVSPKPDQMLRVFMVFKSVETITPIASQVFKPVNRDGFTLVEWGGAELESKIQFSPAL
jgi:hypothetical protein